MSTIDTIYKLWPMVLALFFLVFHAIWVYITVTQLKEEVKDQKDETKKLSEVVVSIPQLIKDVDTLKNKSEDLGKAIGNANQLLISIDERLQFLVTGYKK